MQDIRKPYSRSKSNRTIDARVLAFEKKQYDHDDGKKYSEGELHHKNSTSHRAINKGRTTRFSDKDIAIYPRRDHTISRVPRKNRKFETLLFSGIFSLIVITIVLLTYVFNDATVTITPKFADIDLNKTIIFDNEGKGEVNFILSTTSLSKSRELTRSTETKVQSKAQGKIVIYNKFDSEPQRLIKNTRFESTNGQVFRINDSVIVPGKKGNTPGSVEVTVYADSYGEEYNISVTDFAIPGFKGTPRYDGFFGRSVGSMKGGSSGNTKSVSSSDLSAAKDELALSLTQEIKAELKNKTKVGYVSLANSVAVTFNDNEKEILSGDTNSFTIKATGYLVFANEADLAKAIAKAQSQYKDELLRLDHKDTLTFSLRDTTNITKDPRFEVLVSGSTRVVWVVSESDLRDSLAGKNKDEFSKVMNSFSSIKVAEMELFPSWGSTFPKQVTKINIVEKLPVISK